jgi:hypothetical protein
LAVVELSSGGGGCNVEVVAVAEFTVVAVEENAEDPEAQPRLARKKGVVAESPQFKSPLRTVNARGSSSSSSSSNHISSSSRHARNASQFILTGGLNSGTTGKINTVTVLNSTAGSKEQPACNDNCSCCDMAGWHAAVSALGGLVVLMLILGGILLLAVGRCAAFEGWWTRQRASFSSCFHSNGAIRSRSFSATLDLLKETGKIENETTVDYLPRKCHPGTS